MFYIIIWFLRKKNKTTPSRNTSFQSLFLAQSLLNNAKILLSFVVLNVMWLVCNGNKVIKETLLYCSLFLCIWVEVPYPEKFFSFLILVFPGTYWTTFTDKYSDIKFNQSTHKIVTCHWVSTGPSQQVTAPQVGHKHSYSEFSSRKCPW